LKGDLLNVTNIANNTPFRIVNLLGQEVANGKINNGTILVSNIAIGTYILEVTSEGQTVIKRFIKQ
jgi:hypothetical protein